MMTDLNVTDCTGEVVPLMRRFNNVPLSFSLCFPLQLKQPDKAAAAAHTYFQANPEHVEMGQNLEQYKDVQGIKEEHFVDREARPHQVSQKILICQFGYFVDSST